MPKYRVLTGVYDPRQKEGEPVSVLSAGEVIELTPERAARLLAAGRILLLKEGKSTESIGDPIENLAQEGGEDEEKGESEAGEEGEKSPSAPAPAPTKEAATPAPSEPKAKSSKAKK